MAGRAIRAIAAIHEARKVKTIGLIGGMSWESSLEYYRIINQAVKERLGGLHSAKCLLYSVDFAEIEALQRQNRWLEAGAVLATAAQRIERAGAEVILICTNTMHKMADDVQTVIGVPLLHIADATARRVDTAGIRRVGLLGTRFTMEEDFYRGRLAKVHGLDVLVPDPLERELVHRVIYEELCCGVITESSREDFVGIIESLRRQGAEGIILGCTEIELLIREQDTPARLFPTTRIHAEAAVEFALSE
jgi:aspartate racemase